MSSLVQVIGLIPISTAMPTSYGDGASTDGRLFRGVQRRLRIQRAGPDAGAAPDPHGKSFRLQPKRLQKPILGVAAATETGIPRRRR